MGRIRSLCGLFASLDLPLVYQLFFLCFDAFEQYGCRLIHRVLRDEFATDGKVEYLLT